MTTATESPEQTERATWLEARRQGIGSSDAAAVCGLSPWATPYGVYCDKVFRLDAESSPEMEWGLRLEPVVAQAFTDRTGLELRTVPMLSHPDRPWQMATIDRQAVGPRVPVELKTSGRRDGWGPGGTDMVPEHYFLQVQHQMIVTGSDLAYLAALLGGSDFRIYTIRLDPEIARRLTDIEAAFWDRVERRDAPEPDWSHPSTPKLIERLALPTPDTEMRCAAGSELERMVNSFRFARDEVKCLEQARDEMKAKIIAAMGETSTLFLPDGSAVRRKVVNRAGFTVEPTSYTDFRVSNPKERS